MNRRGFLALGVKGALLGAALPLVATAKPAANKDLQMVHWDAATHTFKTGDRILITDQYDSTKNGIYTVSATTW